MFEAKIILYLYKKNIFDTLLEKLVVIVLKPISDGFVKMEAAGFHLLAADTRGNLQFLHSGRTDSHRTADEFCAESGGHETILTGKFQLLKGATDASLLSAILHLRTLPVQILFRIF